jgi:hypothetical protein
VKLELKLELEEIPKPAAHKTATAIEGLEIHWKGKGVPTKERESVGDSSHPKPPANHSQTSLDRMKER